MGNFSYFPGIDHTSDTIQHHKKPRSISKSSNKIKDGSSLTINNKHQQKHNELQDTKTINTPIINQTSEKNKITLKEIPFINQCTENDSDDVESQNNSNNDSISSHIDNINATDQSTEDSILNNDDEGTNYYFSSTDNDENEESDTNDSSSYIAPAASTSMNKISNRSCVTKPVNIIKKDNVSNSITSTHYKQVPSQNTSIRVSAKKTAKVLQSHVVPLHKTRGIKKSDINDLLLKPKYFVLLENNGELCEYIAPWNNSCIESTMIDDDEEGTNYYFSSSNDSDNESSIPLCIAPAAIINNKFENYLNIDNEMLTE